MVGTARHYFARGNTAHGVHFLYRYAFQGLSKIFLLQGLPGTGKSTTIQRLADELMNQGWSVELFHSPLNPDELDAMIVPEIKIGIADERKCEGLTSMPGVEAVSIDFGPAVDEGMLSEHMEEINTLANQLQESYSKAYETFEIALRIHDEWEKVYIDHMNFHKANQIGQELAQAWFGDETLNKRAVIRHIFFGAATPKGAVDHIQNLTAGLQKRIFIKGRPGSGKSTMLKRLAEAAEKKGYDVDVFHCGFDPNSLDMLILPELSLAIFDSTAPHEYFPNRSGDQILDMYEISIQPGTDERYASELEPIQKRYSQKMKEAISYLAEAQELDAQMKQYYIEATDFSYVKLLQRQLQSDIQKLAVHSQ